MSGPGAERESPSLSSKQESFHERVEQLNRDCPRAAPWRNLSVLYGTLNSATAATRHTPWGTPVG